MDDFLTKMYEEEQEKTASADLQSFMDSLSVDQLAECLGIEKTAIVGPLMDVGNFGIPSAIGYAVGKGEGREMAQAGEKMDKQSILGALMVPGALGYRYGKKRGYRQSQIAAKNKSKTAAVEKTAIVGPLADLDAFGIPSAVGYGLGRGEGKDMARAGEKMDRRSLAAALLVPGALGYRYGKTSGHRRELARMAIEADKKKTAAVARVRNIIKCAGISGPDEAPLPTGGGGKVVDRAKARKARGAEAQAAADKAAEEAKPKEKESCGVKQASVSWADDMGRFIAHNM